MAKQLLSDTLVALRPLETSDAALIYEWEMNSDLWTVSNTISPYSRDIIERYLANYTADIFADRQLRLMVELASTHEPVGLIDLFNFDPMNSRAEMGVMIAPSEAGKGYCSHAVQLVKEYAFNHVGMRQLYVIVPVENDATLHVMDKCGFERTAVLKVWVRHGKEYSDVAVLQCLGG